MENKIVKRNNFEGQAEALSTTAITATPSSMEGLEQFIDEDERAVDLGRNDKFQEMMKRAEPSPASGMAQIGSALCDCLFGSVYENEKGVRFVDFCQRYQNGSFSPRMRVEQSELLTLASCERLGDTADKGTKQKKAKILSKAGKEYLGKFRGEPMELIDIEQILLRLINALTALPIYSDDDRELRRAEFYRQVVEIVSGFQLQRLYPHKSYFALTEEEVMEATQRMGMQKLAFLKKLKDFGFLYLTPSSKGYQVCIRSGYQAGETHTEWRYCIFKFSWFAGMDENENAGYEF